MNEEKFNKMMEDKKKLYSPDFKGNIVKVELQESDVFHCDKVTISIENCSKSGFFLLNKLFKTEIERQKDIDGGHPSFGSFIDLIEKLSKEIKDNYKF